MPKRKRGHSQGLDQLGPTQSWKEGGSLRDWLPNRLGLQHSITSRVLSSARHRNAKITLSDHLFSSDEIITRNLPAIPLQVKYDYPGCINIDDVSNPDDPVIVYMYDSWTKRNV